jgi:hypothetical protein
MARAAYQDFLSPFLEGMPTPTFLFLIAAEAEHAKLQ